MKRFFRGVLRLAIFILSLNSFVNTRTYAQCPAEFPVIVGTLTSYEIDFSSSITNIYWTVSASGTIVGSRTGKTIDVQWNDAGPANVSVVYYVNGVETSRCWSVSVREAIKGGTIASTVSTYTENQIFPYSLLTSSTPGSGGVGQDYGNSYQYQWEESLDGTTWSKVLGATGLDATGSTFMDKKRYFRRLVDDGYNTAYSNTLTINLTTALSPGTIGASQKVLPGGTPTKLSGITAANGGSGTIIYQWESSTDGELWATIGGATAADYQPAALTKSTWFRRKATASEQAGTSNEVQILVKAASGTNIPGGTASSANQTKISPPDYSAVDPAKLNSITSHIVTKPGVKSAGEIPGITAKREITTTTRYLDGLRRTLETVQQNSGLSSQDAVSLAQIDQYGRQNVIHMPYLAITDASNKGKFKGDVNTAQPAFFNTLTQNKEDYFYQQYIAEVSPVSRALKSVDAGKTYGGNNIGFRQSERMNTAEDHIRIWKIGDAVDDLPLSNAEYTTGTLFVSVNTDPDGINTYKYSDREGKTIMTSRQGATAYYKDELRTYYVYDEMGNTRYVIPPLATKDWWTKTSWDFNATDQTRAALKALAYKYYYDTKSRVILSERAGMEGTFSFVYDNRNRVVFVQDVTLKQRNKGEWILYLYDNMDRVKMMALYKNTTATRESLQSAMDQLSSVSTTVTVTTPATKDLYVYSNETKSTYTATNSVNFEPGFDSGESTFTAEINTTSNQVLENLTVNNPLPNLSGYSPLLIYYYDDYNWDGSLTYDKNYSLNPGNNPYPEAISSPSQNTYGKLTGYKKNISGTSDWTTGTIYYDDKGRAFQQLETNFKGGVDLTTSQYDYAGKVLSVFNRITNPKSASDPVIYTQEKMEYDDNGKITQRYYSVSKAITPSPKLINEQSYDDLKRLKSLTIGQGLETLNFDYDLLGRITGINSSFVNNNSGGNYFGMQLSFDNGFSNSKLDGNISGTIWRRKGNSDVAHAYGYTYDSHNRLLKADYSQKASSWSNSEEDYTTSIPQYDDNGNIVKMKQEGMLVGKVKATIDDLTYDYQPSSNRLNGVTDIQGDKGVGDFKNYTGRTGTVDYTYDQFSGNIIGDKNRGISIEYDFLLNKPQKISFNNNANKFIIYTRDVVGNLLERTVKNDAVTNTYTYINGALYKDNVLQFVLLDGGRVRKKSDETFVYDYFIADYLGNTRAVITEETNSYYYKATHEDKPDPAPLVPEKEMFSFPAQVDDIPLGSKFYNYNGVSNKKFVKLNYTEPNRRIGTGKVLRVMAGDQVDMGVLSYYAANSADNNVANKPVNEILNQLVNILLGPATIVQNGKGNLLEGANGILLNQVDFNAFIQENQNDNPSSTIPKAYLNCVLFDDNFQLVDSRAIRVNTPGDVIPLATQLAINKNGYLYVYVSNESNTDVYFDDLVVKHTTGHLLQENSYYPYGLQIQGLSSAALNRLQNDYLFNGIEKISDLDLQLYQAFYRTLDPQTGRWLQIDPVAEKYSGLSGYVNNFNNPVNFTDPLGDDPPWWWQFFQGLGTNGNSPILLSTFEVVGTNLAKNAVTVGASDQIIHIVTPEYLNIEEEYRQRAMRYWQKRIAAYAQAKEAQHHQLMASLERVQSINKFPPVTQYDPGTIKTYVPDWKDKWSESNNIIAKLTYEPADGGWVTIQCLVPFLQNGAVLHIDGRAATETERVRGFANITTAVVTDQAGGLAMKAGAPLIGTAFARIGARIRPRISDPGPTLLATHSVDFGIPKWWTYTTALGEKVWVHPHAMKHLEELAGHMAGNPDYLRLMGKIHQESINTAIEDVFSHGDVIFRNMYISGGNEIMFGAPRAVGEFPTVMHFRSLVVE